MNRRLQNAFTLVELLVVIGIIALLISILLPVLGRAKNSAKNVQCMAQLRNAGQALYVYANDNGGKLPQHASDAIWLWDVALQTRDAMIGKGMTRDTVYCPFFFEQNSDELWNGTFGGVTHDFTVIGYFWLGRRPSKADHRVNSPNLPALIAREYLDSLKVPKYTGNPVFARFAPTKSAETELMCDAVIRQNGYWTAQGGWSNRHVTSHMKGNVPAGANILFLDGHVGFREYKPNATLNDKDAIIRRGAWGSPQIEFWF